MFRTPKTRASVISRMLRRRPNSRREIVDWLSPLRNAIWRWLTPDATRWRRTAVAMMLKPSFSAGRWSPSHLQRCTATTMTRPTPPAVIRSLRPGWRPIAVPLGGTIRQTPIRRDADPSRRRSVATPNSQTPNSQTPIRRDAEQSDADPSRRRSVATPIRRDAFVCWRRASPRAVTKSAVRSRIRAPRTHAGSPSMAAYRAGTASASGASR